jgi:hypothetical protein
LQSRKARQKTNAGGTNHPRENQLHLGKPTILAEFGIVSTDKSILEKHKEDIENNFLKNKNYNF